MIEAEKNFKVNPFYNGLDLCNFYEEKGQDISAIILDIEMPERDGIETARWIRNYESVKQFRRVPIIGLTGHKGEEIKEKCLSAGMDKVLTKPIKKADAIDVLKSFI